MLWSKLKTVGLSVLAAGVLAAGTFGLRAQAPAKAAAESGAARLRYGDGTPDGKKSLGGSGPMIRFTAPSDGAKVAGVRVHGSRYGTPQPPDEQFLVYLLTADGSEVVATQLAPYALFERGEEQWVEVNFPHPVSVPREFWVALDFRAGRTKGVYVSFDTSTGGQHSRAGLPGLKPAAVDFGGDWMVEAVVAR
jgi:RNA polymerase sigma-70 factor (ECF subfamily)